MKKKTEIIFFFPDSRSGHFRHHLGVSYIIAYLRQKGIYSEQFLSYQPIGMGELLKQILSKNPKIVGFTCYDKNYFLIKLIARHLKLLNPNILIIIGGPTATFSDKVILKNIPEVDLCVRGEGEYATYEILNQLKSNGDFSNISGISYRYGNEIIRAVDRPLIKDENNKEEELDIIPSPYLSGVLDPYQVFKNKDYISIVTSRGCIYKCTYCNCTAMSRNTIRYHSVERVISELKMINKLSKYKNDFLVCFYDDVFTLDNQRVGKICHHIIKEKIDLNFRITTRADRLNQKILELLFEAGVREIAFALESAVPRILYNIKKVRFFYNGSKNYFRPERRFIQRVKKSAEIAKKIGFKVETSAIFGLPSETFRDGLKTINFVKKLGIDGYYHNFLNILAGTELFNGFAKNKSDTSESRFKQPFAVLKRNLFLYDVSKIPICENEMVHTRTNKFVSLFLTSCLMGFYKDEGKNIHIQDIILTNEKVPTEWLINNYSFQSRIIFGSNIRNLLSQKEGELKIDALALSKVLCLPIYKKYVNLAKLGKKYNRIPGNYYLFKKYTFFPEFIEKSKEGQDVIFDISDSSDLDELERLFTKRTISSCESYTGGKFNYLLLDSCRWLNFCPAIQLKRIIVDQNYNLLPCFHGKIIGKVGDDLEKIQKNVIGYWQGERKKRGCDDCPVKDNCSQCPFLGNIGYERYCEIKRKYSPIINKFINLLEFKRAIEVYLNLNK